MSAILKDLGGEDTVSEARRQLALNAAYQCARCELMEANALSNDEPLDVKEYLSVAESARRHLLAVGLDRAPEPVESFRERLLRQSRQEQSR